MAGCPGFPWLLFILMYSEVFIWASQRITPNAAGEENEVWPVSSGLAQVLHLFSVDPPTCHHVGPNVEPSGLAVESHCSGQVARMCLLCLPLCCLSASLLLAGALGVWRRKEGVSIDERKWTNTLFIYASPSSSSSSSPIKGYCCHYGLEIEITSLFNHGSITALCCLLSYEANWREHKWRFCPLVVASARKAHHPLRSLPDLHSQIHPDLAVWMTCLLKRNVFSHHWLNGIVAMWGFLCACVISLVMSHQIPISLCLKLIERKESFWSLLVDPPFLLSVPSPIHLSLFSCQLSLLQRDWLRLHHISQESGVPFPHWPN